MLFILQLGFLFIFFNQFTMLSCLSFSQAAKLSSFFSYAARLALFTLLPGMAFDLQ